MERLYRVSAIRLRRRSVLFCSDLAGSHATPILCYSILITSPGGAVAVWASSGMTTADEQEL